MNDWQKEMEDAVNAFIAVAELAGESITLDEFKIEYLPAPHRPPSSLPIGKMAIYAFWWNDQWLKVGKAGPKTAARYTSQHYNKDSTNSNLAKSLANDPQMEIITGFDRNNPDNWIRKSACRVNILIPVQRNKALLSLLEAFLHARLKPRYEG